MAISNEKIAEHRIKEEPFYLCQGDEHPLAIAAFQNKIPLLLKGPTGCGKTRFMQRLAWELKLPLVTVSCHDDLSTADLVGRFLIKGGEAVWVDGPLTLAVKAGAICYLDEIVEARKDTTVVIHPLTDDRRELPIEKLGRIISAPPEFMLAVSYNPGYQSVLKDLKQSTRQRFMALNFDYPSPKIEAEIIMREVNLSQDCAMKLVRFAKMTRELKDAGLQEGASTRLLVHAGRLISNNGIDQRTACRAAITMALTDDHELIAAIDEMVSAVF